MNPPLTDYLGACILKIVEGLGTKANFKNYTWLDEMKSDAVEDLVKRIHNYNPENNNSGKGKGSAYIYTSFIASQAFLRRIQKEKREQYYKYKNLLIIEDDPGVKGLIEESGQSDFHNKIADYERNFNENKEKQKERAEKRKPSIYRLFELCDAEEESTNL